MNTKISAIASSKMLVPVMPRNSLIFHFFRWQTPLRRTRSGDHYIENGTQCPGPVYSEVNTPFTIDASEISGAARVRLFHPAAADRLIERKRRLHTKLLDGTKRQAIRFTEHLTDDGPTCSPTSAAWDWRASC